MFGLQPFHLIIILIVALVIFGPSRLPELGRTLGKTLNEFRDASARAGQEMRQEMSEKPETKSDLAIEKTDA